MLSDYKSEMFAIFENNSYRVTTIKDVFNTTLMFNHITRRTPKKNIYIAIK